MPNTTLTFERIEKKYLLSPCQMKMLNSVLSGRFIADEHGRSTILSLYYDTPDYALIRASLAKPAYKEKLRLRSYGVPEGSTTVFLEIKKKAGGIVYKRRVPLSMEQARAFNTGALLGPQFGQIGREIEWMRHRYSPAPRALIICEREAFFARETPDLRLTFDTDIRFRTRMLDPGQGTAGTLLCPGQILMEVKIPGALPFWLARIFSELSIRPVSFSKYGAAYTQFLSQETMTGEQYAAIHSIL